MRIRFKITPDYRYELSLGPKQFGDTELVLGLYLLPRRRLCEAGRGPSLTTPVVSGSGFKISNPSRPRAEVPPTSFRPGSQQGGLRVRRCAHANERKLAQVEGSVLYDGAEEARLDGLAKDTRLVFICHHGTRSSEWLSDLSGRASPTL